MNISLLNISLLNISLLNISLFDYLHTLALTTKHGALALLPPFLKGDRGGFPSHPADAGAIPSGRFGSQSRCDEFACILSAQFVNHFHSIAENPPQSPFRKGGSRCGKAVPALLKRGKPLREVGACTLEKGIAATRRRCLQCGKDGSCDGSAAQRTRASVAFAPRV